MLALLLALVLHLLRLARRPWRKRPSHPYRQVSPAQNPTPHWLVWGLDLTGKADAGGAVHAILGILDHGSRASLSLTAPANKSSFTLLGYLCLAIGTFSKPKAVRTDNETVFTSKLFRFALFLLGIRHQRTDLHCPWQNGRIERFFGTRG